MKIAASEVVNEENNCLGCEDVPPVTTHSLIHHPKRASVLLETRPVFRPRVKPTRVACSLLIRELWIAVPNEPSGATPLSRVSSHDRPEIKKREAMSHRDSIINWETMELSHRSAIISPSTPLFGRDR
ncbi:hypothetical protein CDAR_515551 [Caerostris darwini]|uniref:Uncharacterized protein n=1 Tax=Caerostris darwini TaxID=1538125 RepID=A0AAV4S0X9_9ARAC|nr:hypothetical protein CDAR_515551 [Caerostris darwini]